MRTAIQNHARLLESGRIAPSQATSKAARLLFSSFNFRFLRIVLGILLLCASLLKSYELFSSSAINEALTRDLLLALITAELVIGGWFISGYKQRLVWAVALLIFSGFACYSAISIFLGHKTCGCFGRLAVNPHLTFLIDLFVVWVLLLCRPLDIFFSRFSIENAPANAFTYGIHSIKRITSVRASVALCTIAISTFSLDFVIGNFIRLERPESSSTIVLQPEQWVGKRFPLIPQIDVGEQLSQGQWNVIIYHYDCPRCQQLIHDFDLHANAIRNPTRLALIEVAPYRPTKYTYALDHKAESSLCGRLTDAKEWFVATPLVITIQEGIVSTISYPE